MLKIKHSLLNYLGTGITLAVIGAAITPASAQNVIIIDGGYGVNRSPNVGSFIYGSPIPTPMPVDPVTGLTPGSDRHYYSYPSVRQNVINDSTLVNPVIINNSWRRTPFRGESRVILNDSWHHTPSRGQWLRQHH